MIIKKFVLVFLVISRIQAVVLDIDNIPDDPQLIMINDFSSQDDGFLQPQQFFQPNEVQIEMKQNYLNEDVDQAQNNINEVDYQTISQSTQLPQLEAQNGFNAIQEKTGLSFIQEISSLQDSESKLNWNIFSSALKDMLEQAQNARKVEGQRFDAHKALSDRVRQFHERIESSLKVDLAHSNKQLEEQDQPLKAELEEALKYRQSITDQIKDQGSANDAEYELQRKNLSRQQDDVSQAQETIDEMIALFEQAKSDSFVQVQERLSVKHQHIHELLQGNHNEPIGDMVSSLAQLFSQGFKETQSIKQAQSMLEQLRKLTLTYKLELMDSAQNQDRFYQDRKAVMSTDAATNDEIYRSKLQQYGAVLAQISLSQEFRKQKEADLKSNADLLDFQKRVYVVELDIHQTVDHRQADDAVAYSEALKYSGQGVEFEGNMLN